ncbi:RNA polymerase sigma factor [Phyllobacterium myrsinacearum]|uniref:RNA polymerase sigma-70 factor (ECF subfamily) n=1 Tax=Phyllobacterium myrsinacearum TaxID=28101 RepID=A0A839ELK3_9HYPH|nr:RNA polymerase sigma factor [Phyllobacterium myrsinacearum]MBA8880931.1 RNA polymerase sigma-70 factor (ECF subfamily) [Phyllobacterium myrsinacearum]
MQEVTSNIYRMESRRILATLIRLLGNFELAEEALHDAFVAAAEQWPRDGVPVYPRAWLISTGRFKAIDKLRRRARFDASLTQLALQIELDGAEKPSDREEIKDDRLRLIFTCCHPLLTPDMQLALTLREVCGLKTEEIARAFLTSAPTVAQRIVRAKAKIREACVPYEIPALCDLRDRLEIVLHVIYLIFNEGYSFTSDSVSERQNLCDEAIRLGCLLIELVPDPEAAGLLALMLLQGSRRDANRSPDKQIILLHDQDRSRWHMEDIVEGTKLVNKVMAGNAVGFYTLQAAIAAVHAQARSTTETNWNRIVALYDLLLLADPSPVIELNRAVAIAMRDGPNAGLSLIDALLNRGELHNYHLAHATRADLLRRLDKPAEAQQAYQQALHLTVAGPDQRFIQGKLAELKVLF